MRLAVVVHLSEDIRSAGVNDGLNMGNQEETGAARENPEALAEKPVGTSFRMRPASRSGRWAGRFLIGAAGIWIAASVLSALFGRSSGGLSEDVLRITGPLIGVAFVGSGIGALATSVHAIVAHRERSWVVWLGLLIGAWSMVFLLGELFLPH